MKTIYLSKCFVLSIWNQSKRILFLQLLSFIIVYIFMWLLWKVTSKHTFLNNILIWKICLLSKMCVSTLTYFQYYSIQWDECDSDYGGEGMWFRGHWINWLYYAITRTSNQELESVWIFSSYSHFWYVT